MHYDEYLHRWVIDYEPLVEWQSSCEECEGRKQLGIDACQGCAG